RHLLSGPSMRTPGSRGPEATMPTLYFPQDPSLDHLRGQARTLLRKLREGDEHARGLFAQSHPRPPATPRLADAQLALARAYGFTSWPDLRRHLDVVTELSRPPPQVAAPAPGRGPRPPPPAAKGGAPRPPRR